MPDLMTMDRQSRQGRSESLSVLMPGTVTGSVHITMLADEADLDSIAGTRIGIEVSDDGGLTWRHSVSGVAGTRTIDEESGLVVWPSIHSHAEHYAGKMVRVFLDAPERRQVGLRLSVD